MKIGLIGRNSTHFEAYSNLFINRGFQCSYLNENAPLKKITSTKSLSNLSLEDMVNSSDLIMITNRFANEHLPVLKKIIELEKYKGKIFIDKPIVQDLNEVNSILELKNKFDFNKITSFSPLRFCKELEKLNRDNSLRLIKVSGPLRANDIGKDPRFLSPLFYGSHVVEIAFQIIKNKNLSQKNNFSVKDCGNFLIISNDFYEVNLNLVDNDEEFYSIEYTNQDNSRQKVYIELDGTYYNKCIDQLLLFSDNKEHQLPSVFEACQGIKILLGKYGN